MVILDLHQRRAAGLELEKATRDNNKSGKKDISAEAVRQALGKRACQL
jgi:hypothetical protein